MILITVSKAFIDFKLFNSAQLMFHVKHSIRL